MQMSMPATDYFAEYMINSSNAQAVRAKSPRVWPDSTGTVGDEQLWTHFIDVLCTSGSYPSGWEQSVESLSEAQLLLAFNTQLLFVQPIVHEQWPVALAFVRTRLQAINPTARIAFTFYPENDRDALECLRTLSASSLLDELPLPNDVGYEAL